MHKGPAGIIGELVQGAADEQKDKADQDLDKLVVEIRISC